jgi:hypothetical protein
MTHTAQRLVFVFLAVLVWVVVITKAVTQPFVHDEARCYYLYVQTGEFLPYHSHWDAGNHVLSSFAAWIFTSVLGVSHLSLRLFSILCFPLYAAYGWCWASQWKGWMLRWSFLLAWIGTPFVLEFFWLFRGYGPALAFMAMGLFHGVRWVERSATRDLVLALVALLLADWANLGLVIVHALVVASMFVFLWVQRRGLRAVTWMIWTLLGLLPLVFALIYGMALSERGLLYYGTTNGLFSGTLASLLHFTLGLDRLPIRLLVLGLVVGMLLVVVRTIKSDGPRHGVVFVVAILLLELAVRWLMWMLSDTPLPVDRTALHYQPLFILALALSVDRIQHFPKGRIRWVAALMLLFPMMAYRTFSNGRSVIWPDQQVGPELMRALAAPSQRSDQAPIVGGSRYLQPVVQLEARTQGMVVPLLDDVAWPDPKLDHLLLDTLHETVPLGHRIIHRSVRSALVLTERISPCSTRVLCGGSQPPATSNTDEFRDLYRGQVFDLAGSPIRLDLDAQFHTSSPAMAVDLVVEQFDAKGQKIADQRIALRTLWRSDRNGHIHLARLLPAQVDGSLLIFLYNPERITYTMDHLELTLSTVHCE